MTRWKAPSRPVVKLGAPSRTGRMKGGPLHGISIIRRGYAHDATLTFTLAGQTGRYEELEWRQS